MIATLYLNHLGLTPMKSITIKIKMENAAFGNWPHDELARILKNVASDAECGSYPEIIRDINGNQVGKLTIK